MTVEPCPARIRPGGLRCTLTVHDGGHMYAADDVADGRHDDSAVDE